MLYRLIFKNEKSKALITATFLSIYSSLTLAVFFALSERKFNTQAVKLGTEIYYIFCYELSFTCAFITHGIMFYQYWELSLTMPIYSKIAEYAQDAHNKINSIRQCIQAILVIYVAVLVAHFVDKSFYIVKESSTMADNTITYFALAMKSTMIVMETYIFVRLR